jgi:xanthine dehydrogenase small subunit
VHTTLRFRLNGRLIELKESGGAVLIDWLRQGQGLTGTKEGCREGDCGACLVLLGEPPADSHAGKVEWIPVTSCLLALGDLDGRHVITIEGLAADGPTPVMEALHDENASQCGFCSPGIVVALTARLLEGGTVHEAALAAALEGNLCRCTGYASIRRAAAKIAAAFSDLPADFSARLDALASRGVVPPSLAATMRDLPPAATHKRHPAAAAAAGNGAPNQELTIGGGTDWFVRHPDPEPDTEIEFADRQRKLRAIRKVDGNLEIGAAATVREFFASKAVRAVAAGIEAFEADVASPPIRTRATLAGNIANASPVADMTAMLLALGARIRLCDRRDGSATRTIDLDRYFLGYKKTAAAAEERIETIIIPETARPRVVVFEKAAKRARLDIAAVNTAMACVVDRSGALPIVRDVRISAGGVGPTPLYLAFASAFAEGKEVTPAMVKELAAKAAAGTTPMSDVRGSAGYRRTMVERLVIAHFLRLFPELKLEEELFA